MASPEQSANLEDAIDYIAGTPTDIGEGKSPTAAYRHSSSKILDLTD
ncbi:hypothetical protein [Caballeronia sp. RCC_10]